MKKIIIILVLIGIGLYLYNSYKTPVYIDITQKEALRCSMDEVENGVLYCD